MSKTVSGAASQFLWDVAGSLPLLLKDGTDAYVYGPGGLPLEQVSGSAVVWLHHDQLGSTRLVTDSSGVNQAAYTFDPYGKLTASTGSISNPFLFAGQYADAESGLYYLRARYYDLLTAGFLTRDPAIASTHEPYAYASDNPLNLGDPTGLCDWNPLSGGFCGYQVLSKTPLGKPLSQLVQGDATVADEVHTHGVLGGSLCAFVCATYTYQDGTQGVNIGCCSIPASRAVFLGWANLPPNQRQDCQLSGGVGPATISQGIDTSSNDVRNWHAVEKDWEVDATPGFGLNFSVPVWTHRD